MGHTNRYTLVPCEKDVEKVMSACQIHVEGAEEDEDKDSNITCWPVKERSGANKCVGSGDGNETWRCNCILVIEVPGTKKDEKPHHETFNTDVNYLTKGGDVAWINKGGKTNVDVTKTTDKDGKTIWKESSGDKRRVLCMCVRFDKDNQKPAKA